VAATGRASRGGARSSRDLHNIIGELQDRGCRFISLGDSWCDTTSDVGKLLLAIMGGIAEFERDLIRKRCLVGIERASAKGTKFGRPVKLDAGERSELLGVQRPSLTHAVAELEESGLILRGRRQITILDRQGLIRASCECYQLLRERVASHLPQTYVDNGVILPRRK
jgi:DNA-binding transcriptional ArsR family regulator